MSTKTVSEAGLYNEESFLWATAALGEARRERKRRSAALLEAVVEELAFDLGAAAFPPEGARAARGLPVYGSRGHTPSRTTAPKQPFGRHAAGLVFDERRPCSPRHHAPTHSS
jgi:hypothetical protein